MRGSGRITVSGRRLNADPLGSIVVGFHQKCDRCGRSRRRWLYRIPYADFPPRKFATTGALRRAQLGTLEVRTCPQCVWAHSKIETIAGAVLIFLILLFSRLSQPNFPMISWKAVVAGTAFVLMVVVFLPFLPRGSKRFKRAVFYEQRSRLALQHGIPAERLRPIIPW